MELNIVCTSQSTLQTYLIDWKERRQDLSREKVGIQLCLSKLPPPTKAALTATDMQYKKTLLVRQVKIKCQIGELNEKIEKGEELLEDLKKPVPHRKHKFSGDYFWDDPVPEKESLPGYQPPAKSRTKVDSRRPVFGRSSSAERKKTFRRPENTPQVYIQTAATD